jgi:hypothetical protein
MMNESLTWAYNIPQGLKHPCGWYIMQLKKEAKKLMNEESRIGLSLPAVL